MNGIKEALDSDQMESAKWMHTWDRLDLRSASKASRRSQQAHQEATERTKAVSPEHGGTAHNAISYPLCIAQLAYRQAVLYAGTEPARTFPPLSLIRLAPVMANN